MRPFTLLILSVLLSWAVLPPSSVRADDFLSPGMSPAELKERLEGDSPPLIVDLRAPVEFRIVHIPGALNIPLPEIEEHLDELQAAQARGILIYCLNGTRTRQAEPILYAHDIESVYHLEGTLQAWLGQGYPIEKGGPEPDGWH